MTVPVFAERQGRLHAKDLVVCSIGAIEASDGSVGTAISLLAVVEEASIKPPTRETVNVESINDEVEYFRSTKFVGGSVQLTTRIQLTGSALLAAYAAGDRIQFNMATGADADVYQCTALPTECNPTISHGQLQKVQMTAKIEDYIKIAVGEGALTAIVL